MSDDDQKPGAPKPVLPEPEAEKPEAARAVLPEPEAAKADAAADDSRPFVKKADVRKPGVRGARWWHEGMASSTRAQADSSRRGALRKLAVLAGAGVLVGTGVGLYFAVRKPDDVETSADSLELQKREGWDVGDPDGALELPGATAMDVESSASWQSGLDDSLAGSLAPTSVRLLPFQVPTLFQVVGLPQSANLRYALRPIHTPAMEQAFGRAGALGELFAAVEWPTDTAIVLDLPGPEAVAAAAALAPHFEPVFVLDNWPHPLGVVPSHHTLAAALYYLPTFRRAKSERARLDAPVFVLDRNRLAPYHDDGDRFDNRYTARLPGAEALRKLDLKHVLYLTPDDKQLGELDDLNDEMVALDKAGIDVKVVAMSDFQPGESNEAGAETSALLAAPGRPAPPVAAAPPGDGGARAATATSTVVHHHYHYGSPLYGSYWFWSAYAWHAPPRVIVVPGRAAPPPPPPRPSNLSGGHVFRPQPRPTVFSSRTVGGVASGVGKQKPSGFGRVSYRASSQTGRFVSPSLGRSGSFGRTRYGGTSA